MIEVCTCGCGKAVSPGKRFAKGHYSREKRRQERGPYGPRGHMDPPNPSGMCLCGCGQPTGIAKITSYERGQLAGHHVRYRPGHAPKVRGEEHHLWKGGQLRWRGYVLLYMPDDPRANSKGYVPEHRVVWESANGRALRANEHIHHVNGIKDDNRPENLVALTRSQHGKEHGLGTHFTPEERRANGSKGAAAQRSRASQRVGDLIVFAREIIAKYGDDPQRY